MTDTINMVMPMAGRGSRFGKNGYELPKPLIQIAGKPLFYWATLGFIRQIPEASLVYIVLQEHVEAFQIDECIKTFFPSAMIISIPEVTSGALETVLRAHSLISQGAVVVCDCDNAFQFKHLKTACDSLHNGADGFLSHFPSNKPHFSYALYSQNGQLLKTVEKSVISNRAIAGIYGFRNFQILNDAAVSYKCNCPYPELYLSGVYNELVSCHRRVCGFDLDFLIPLGTPEEYEQALKRVDDLYRMQEI